MCSPRDLAPILQAAAEAAQRAALPPVDPDLERKREENFAARRAGFGPLLEVNPPTLLGP
jgi:hypothetical protein